MALTIHVPVADMAIPEVDTLSHTFRNLGGRNKLINGKVVFPFDPAGEDYFSKEAYDLGLALKWQMDGGEFYTIITDEQMGQDVPVEFPNRHSVIVVDGTNSVVRTWSNYTIASWDLGDGTWLVRCLHYPVGETTSKSGLLDAERKLWSDEFGTLLVKSEGLKLRPTVELAE